MENSRIVLFFHFSCAFIWLYEKKVVTLQPILIRLTKYA